MMKRINYFLEMRLGKKNQYVLEFPDYLCVTPPFGLGHQPTD